MSRKEKITVLFIHYAAGTQCCLYVGNLTFNLGIHVLKLKITPCTNSSDIVFCTVELTVNKRDAERLGKVWSSRPPQD